MGISRDQALDCLRSDDLIGVGMEADAVRRGLHPEGVATYTLERPIHCAGVCEAKNAADFDKACVEICDKAGEAVERGATGIALEGWPAQTREIEPVERLFAEIKRRYPSVWLQALHAPEIDRIAAVSGSSVHETLTRLRGSGLDSIGAEGMETAGSDDWIEVHRAAHGLGIRTAAAIVFGAGETIEQRVDALLSLRQLQETTGGFTAFIPVSFRAKGGRELDDATAVESLKMLAVSRMLLDNIDHMQWGSHGDTLKVRQMGLRFGGNDLGSAAFGDGSAASKAGSEEDLRRIIRDAGFMPVRRDSSYRTMFLN
jgi:cyclic dehypoxanthinyl futalosine synthase